MLEDEGVIDLANEISNGIINRCPLFAGRLEVVNLTSFDILETILGSEPSVVPYETVLAEEFMKKHWFKGDLRGTLVLKTKFDPKGLQISGIYTISGRKLDTF